MAIANEIATLKTNITNAYNSINTKGGTIPTNKNTENLSSAIESIPSGSSATLGTKNITSNGTYKASDDNLDGYSQVNVDVRADVNWDEYYTNPLTQAGSPSIASSLSFGSITRSIKKIPSTLNITSYVRLCEGCYNLINVDFLKNKVLGADCSYMLQYCEKLQTIPQLDTSNVTNMTQMFNGCSLLKNIPLLDTSKVTNMLSTFSYCKALETIPQLDTSNVTSLSYLFQGCTSLQTIPLLNTSKATSFNGVFSGCTNLTSIPQLNTNNATNLSSMFNNCTKLATLPKFNTQKVINLSGTFNNCTHLTTFGGLENLGQGYTTTASANTSSYTLTLSACTKLTEQSIINVLNNLYDIKTKGCKAQKVVLGATNLAKLTSEEGQQALSQAQSFGWSIS